MAAMPVNTAEVVGVEVVVTGATADVALVTDVTGAGTEVSTETDVEGVATITELTMTAVDIVCVLMIMTVGAAPVEVSMIVYGTSV